MRGWPRVAQRNDGTRFVEIAGAKSTIGPVERVCQRGDSRRAVSPLFARIALWGPSPVLLAR
jgi:hypothetical protein